MAFPAEGARMAFSAEGASAIYLFGICAAIPKVCTVFDLSLDANRPLLLSIDNQAALSALTKGSASPELGTVLVGDFWAVATRIPGAMVDGVRPHGI